MGLSQSGLPPLAGGKPSSKIEANRDSVDEKSPFKKEKFTTGGTIEDSRQSFELELSDAGASIGAGAGQSAFNTGLAQFQGANTKPQSRIGNLLNKNLNEDSMGMMDSQDFEISECGQT